MINFITKNRLYTILSILLILLTWEILSRFVVSEMILPSPEKTILKTLTLFIQKNFLLNVSITILRGLLGFAISLLLGLVLGIIAGINKSFHAFLTPILVTIRSTPVISIILLALIWLNVDKVPIFIGFLTMFPFICTNIMEGINNVDVNLLRMTHIYRIPRAKVVSDVYLPSIMPYLFSGISSAMGFGWRAIIIGEVLSQPEWGIGTQMQSAQTYLIVEEVIAWTVIAIIISYLFEKIIRSIQNKIITWQP